MTKTASSRSPNNSAKQPLAFVVIGNPENRRVALFQASLRQLGHPPAFVVSYVDLLTGASRLEGCVAAGSIVRIESPGESFAVEKLFLKAGLEAARAEGRPVIECAAIDRLEIDYGRIRHPRQYHLGFLCALAEIKAQLRRCPPHARMNAIADIELFFDKRLTQHRLLERGFSIPPSLHVATCFEEIEAAARSRGWNRIFIKLANSSSASGAVALQMGERCSAATTVELVRQADDLKFYNSLKIRSYKDRRDIAAIVDFLCREGVQVEKWLPKATLGNQAFDLRVLAIAGAARHVVVRQSNSPMTNLHLGNRRGDVVALKEKMGAKIWQAHLDNCAAAAREFPQSHHIGIDLLIEPGFRRGAILELNAFGDLLPGVLDEGMDAYTAEIAAFDVRRSAGVAQ